MKRKVIKQGHNTLTVTLPRKWCNTQNLVGGDEVNIEEEGLNLILTPPGKRSEKQRLELNLSNLDRSSVLFYIREAYRRGYDELRLRFENQMTPRFRNGKAYKTISFIHYEINRLIGYEIVEEKQNSCLIRDISEGTDQEFGPILRRVFLLVLDTYADLLKGLKEEDQELVATIEEKHDTITKFASYCMRLISKNIYNYSYENNLEYYHVLASLDNIADFMKYTTRDIIEQDVRLSSKTHAHLEKIGLIIRIFYGMFFDFKSEKLVDFNKERYVLLKAIRASTKQLKTEEALIVNKLEGIVEVINDLVKSKLNLSF